VVLGRRELSAILLAIAAIVFYLILLSTTPSGAQTGGITTSITISNVTNQSNQGGVTASVNPSQKPQRERSIINIPRKPLPPSGGLPVVATVASFVLTGTALLALGIVIRRGSRR
jgi:hypothetical protein